MNRLNGMMPRNEIDIEERLEAASEEGKEFYYMMIQAGKNGWTVIYGDSSTVYKDVVDTSENNFKSAMTHLKKSFPIIKNSMINKG